MSTVSRNHIFDFDQVTTDTNSIFDLLLSKDNNLPFEDSDDDSIFQEISRLAEKSNPNESRSVEEIILEAESLIEQGSKNKVSSRKSEKCFDKVCEKIKPDDSVISEESTPKLTNFCGDTTTTQGVENYDTEADVCTLKDEENDDSVSFIDSCLFVSVFGNGFHYF